MEFILDANNILLSTLVLGFAGAIVLLAYTSLRSHTLAHATQDTAPATTPAADSSERVHRAARPERKGSDRAA
jgi:hypothetical protein